MWEQIKRLFDNEVVVTLGIIWAWIVSFLFPTPLVATAAGAALIMMVLDLMTKIFALARQNGGLRRAFKCRKISSNKFARGTLDKLIIFGVMLVISGCAYNLMFIPEISTWFAQVIFTIMFLRDALSIIENLHDAGVQGLGLFKKVVKKKLDKYCDDEEAKK